MKEYKLVNLNISDLQLDPDNPNQLSKKQKTALQQVIKKYGFLVPVIVDEHTMKVIDGEHRLIAYRQLGYEQIPGFVIDTAVEDYDKKFLRQFLNKMHGSPDPEKDLAELEAIMEDETGAAMLEQCLDIDAESLKEMSESIPEDSGTAPDEDDQADKMRKIVLYFTKIEYPEIQKQFDRLKEDYQVTTETEVVKALLEHRESSI